MIADMVRSGGPPASSRDREILRHRGPVAQEHRLRHERHFAVQLLGLEVDACAARDDLLGRDAQKLHRGDLVRAPGGLAPVRVAHRRHEGRS